MSVNAKDRMAATLLLNQVIGVGVSTLEQIKAVLSEFDLTESLAGVLWALDPDAPPSSMRDIARRLRCDPSNVTLMSGKLERAGLVERQPHPSDGRVRVLALTERGRQVWTELVDRLMKTSPVFCLDGDEQRQLSTLLATVESASRRPMPVVSPAMAFGGSRT